MTYIEVVVPGQTFVDVEAAQGPPGPPGPQGPPGADGGAGTMPPAPTGELGGTWAATTVDGIHAGSAAGSSHDTAVQQAVAGANLNTTIAISDHQGAADPHPGYLTPAEGNSAYAPISGSTNYAPPNANYLVTSANAILTGEIVVGSTPGGELGGTWPSPTVDATHAGSTHLALGSTGSTAAAGNHTHPAVWVQMTQAAYDALGTKDPLVLYVIVG
jgi:hypothetical protein